MQTFLINGYIVDPRGPVVDVARLVGIETGATAIEDMHPEAGRREVRAALTVPAAVTRDAVQEHDERAAAGDAQCDARRTGYQNGFQAYSTLAPEILTASARFALSFSM